VGVPYEIPPMAGIVAADATPIVVEIDWPDRSIISKIIVVQTGGTGEAFTVALFNHSQVSTGEATSDSVGAEVGLIPDDCYRVTPDLVATAGKLIYFSDQATGGYGYVFFGQKSLVGRQGQRIRKLYLRITPASSSAKTFALVVGGQKEVE